MMGHRPMGERAAATSIPQEGKPTQVATMHMESRVRVSLHPPTYQPTSAAFFCSMPCSSAMPAFSQLSLSSTFLNCVR